MADRGTVGAAGSGAEVLAGTVARAFEHPTRGTHAFTRSLMGQLVGGVPDPTPGAPNTGQLWPRHGYVAGS